MPDIWEFVNIEQDETRYADGTVVPHLDAVVLCNKKKVGRINVHMHKHAGRDKVTDASFGFTGVIYGPLQEGN